MPPGCRLAAGLQGSSQNAQPAGPALAASPDSGKVVRNQYCQGSSQNAQPPAGPALAASPGGGEGSQKSTLWPARLPASRGPVKTLSRTARRWREACTAGKVLRNQYWGRNFAYIQNSCPEVPSRRQREARTAGKVLRNQHRGRNFAYIQNSCPEAPARR